VDFGDFSYRNQNQEEKEEVQAPLFPGNFLQEDNFRLIGQYQNSYILIEKEGSLLLIDQHNAHEKVNFDRLKKNYRENSTPTIAPLFPIIIELTPSEHALLFDHKMELLEKLGFQLEMLSGHSLDVKKFPQILEERNLKDTILSVIHMKYSEVGFEDKVLAQVACKSAIKVNHKLHPEEMKKITRNLFETENPYYCPHQRPIIITFTLLEIEKLLKRK